MNNKDLSLFQALRILKQRTIHQKKQERVTTII